jgi:hypothetical protein
MEEFVMALFSGRKRSDLAEVLDPNPGIIEEMPARPYRVLHADVPFYSDPGCKRRIEGVNLVVLGSEDPHQQHQVQECMPTRKKYKAGQLVCWDLNYKQVWQNCWYRNPQTANIEVAWTQAVEFVGKVVTAGQQVASARTGPA